MVGIFYMVFLWSLRPFHQPFQLIAVENLTHFQRIQQLLNLHKEN